MPVLWDEFTKKSWKWYACTTYLSNLSHISLGNWSPFSGEVRRIHLPINSCNGCGGYELSVSLHTGNSSCSTTIKESFSSGDNLIWSRRQLGDCQGFTVHSRTKIALHTSQTNKYAVQGTMTIYTDSTSYNAFIPNGWRSMSDNLKTYGIVGKCSLKFIIVFTSCVA